MAADRLRDEAERLVVAALAAVSSATRGLAGPGGGFATGSAECCVCPVCRAIAAMRDPSSDLADRLAAGVGDLASGVATVLRTLSTRGGRDETTAEDSASTEGDQFWEELRRKATEAAKAYARPSTGDGSPADDPWRAATREPSREGDEPGAVPETLVSKPAVVKKAVAKKAVAKKAVAKQAVPRPAGEAESPPARKVAAPKVAKKAALRDGEA